MKEAKVFAGSIDRKAILVDEKMLADLMIDHRIGVSDVDSYAVERFDSDYFRQDWRADTGFKR